MTTYLFYIEELLNEDLTKLKMLSQYDNIKADEDYVNDYLQSHKDSKYVLNKFRRDKAGKVEIPVIDNVTVLQYEDCPIFPVLKHDMFEMCDTICKELKTFSGVLSAWATRSTKLGISTYIHVKYDKPDYNSKEVKEKKQEDKDFIKRFEDYMEDEFEQEFRISTHTQGHENVNYNIDVRNHVYKYFRDKVREHVKDQVKYIRKTWKEYIKTSEIPEEQLRRIEKHRSRGEEAEYYEALKYLKYSNTTVETITKQINFKYRKTSVHPSLLSYIYKKCLSENIIEYTLDPNFNFKLLCEDIDKMLKEFE